MSEKNKKTVCPSCGAEVPVNESKSLKKICNILRGVMEDDPADWEDVVEEPQVSEDPSEELQTVSIEKTQTTMTLGDQIKKIVSYKLINRIAIAALALVMLLLAFAPFTSYPVGFEEAGVSYQMNYSGTDNLRMTATSAYLMGENLQLAQSNEESLSTEAFSKMNLITATNMKMGMSFTAILATVGYVLYLILCIAFLAFAVKDLISEFFAAKKNRVRLRKYTSDTLLCLLLCVFPVVAFLLLQACEVSMGNAVLLNSGAFLGAKLSWGAVLSFVLALLGTIFVCISHSFGALRLHGRYFDRMRIKHIISVVLVVVLLLSMFLPCIQIRLWNQETNDEQTTSVSLWDIRETTKNERIVYQRAGVYANQKYEELIAQGKLSDQAGEEFVNTVFLTSKMANIRVLYTAIELFTALTLIFAGVLLWSLLRRGFFSGKRLRMVNFFKVVTLVAVAIDLILLIVMQQTLALSLPNELVYSVDFKLGSGIIIMLVCALLTVTLRLSAKKEVNYVDEDYDNADVSYAPYVLGLKK